MGAAGLQFPQASRHIALIVLILCIGLSRIYLGVHFASDVLLGWAAGGLLLLAFLRLEKRVAAWVGRRSLNGLLAYIAVSSVLLVGLVVGMQASLGAWQVPPEWSEQALAKTGAEIDPINLEGAFTLGGTWLGLLGGAAWLVRRRGGLATRQPGSRCNWFCATCWGWQGYCCCGLAWGRFSRAGQIGPAMRCATSATC